MIAIESVPGEIIKLSFINNRVMTFNDEDYMTIRRKFRIVGKLIGVPVAKPRNVQWHGLPAVYSQFEAKLMIEKNLATIEDKSMLRNPPSDEIKEMYNKFINETNLEVQTSYIENRLTSTRLRMPQIIKGKRNKLLKSGIPENEIEITSEDVLKEEAERLRSTFSSSNLATQIPTQFPFPQQLNFDKITNFQVQDMDKFRVFQDLWEKNFYVTNGDSFGADFLAYPGDPMQFHASQIVHVIDIVRKFNVKYLVSCARNSIAVNKKCLFAYINMNGQVEYQTLEWDNPKLRQQFQPPTTSQNETMEH